MISRIINENVPAPDSRATSTCSRVRKLAVWALTARAVHGQLVIPIMKPITATERVLMEVVRRGADRQAVHEVIREHSLAAWAALRSGQPNPLAGALAGDARLTTYATPDQLRGWLDASDYVGDAPERARALAQMIEEALAASPR